MSYTRAELASAALEEIGIAEYEFDISPDMRQSVIRRMDMMMAEWDVKGIHLSFPISKEENTEPDDDSGIPDWAWEAVITNLAVRIAPSYGKTVSPDTKTFAKNAYNTLCIRATQPREMQLESMPRGAGWKYNRDTARWTPAPSDPYLTPIDGDVDLTGEPV